MNILVKQLIRLSSGVALGLYLSAPVLAADIEIYTDSNASATTAQPNVLFIMDSSDSMRRIPSASAPAAAAYDPDVDYPTSGTGSFEATKYYYSSSGTPPASPSTSNSFDTAALHCDHALHEYQAGVLQETAGVPNDGPLDTAGFYSGQMAQFKNSGGTNNDEWRGIITSNSVQDYVVECKQDQDVHGENGTTNQKHIKDGSNADNWQSAEDATLIASLWPELSDNYYTVYHSNYLNFLEEAPTTTSGDSVFRQMQNAIETIVAAASNINIGFMQFDTENTGTVADDGLAIDLNGDGDADDSVGGEDETGDISDDTDPATATGGEGGGIQYQIQDVNLGRQNFYTTLRNLKAGADAPVSETYYEALKYFGGELVDYGTLAAPPLTGAATATGSGNDTYESPITDTCQKNVIILLSSGLSSYDYLNNTRRSSLHGFDATSCGNTSGTDDYDPTDTNRNATTSDSTTDDNCLDELADWAFTDDVARRDEVGDLGGDTADYSVVHAGEQNISTFTVGVAFPDDADLDADELAALQAGEQLLRDAAEKGGGEFLEAEDEAALVVVLNNLLTNILKVNSTFSSPAVSVNAFNRSTHLNDLYFTLFKPDDAEHWIGNLKKFKLLFDSDGVPFIADKNGNAAVSDTTGFFNESSFSLWSDAIDGDEAAEGGAAQLIGNTAIDGTIPVRKVYTITGSYTNGSGRLDGVKTPAVQNLTDADNLFSTTNSTYADAATFDAAFDTLLNIAAHPEVITGVDYRDTLVDWANGKDVFDEVSGSDSRRVMGDPLHAEPALVQYGSIADGSDADTDVDPDLVSYVATNDGYLHAIDSRDASPNDSPSDTGGTELWAFIPQEILPNLDALLEDDGSEGKMYGLDGSVVPWIYDADSDGVITENASHTYPDDDHVYLYFGMRRGLENLRARNYIYALDVTDRDTPKLMWMIEAGTGTYDELGQTWSTINVEKIKVGNAERTVLMFGGGYDYVTEDNATTRVEDTMGRAIYIVDAQTGERLWSAGSPNSTTTHDLELTDMKYSIPSRIKPLDINGDGYIDRIYLGDMGGQLWRFDIALSTATTFSDSLSDVNTELKDELITGGRIANFAVDSDTTQNRRFFYPPDVAFIVEEGQGAYLSILAASGYRAHPLQTDTHDRMYMIRDKDIYDAPVDTSDPPVITYTTVTEASDLYDATDNLITEGATSSDRAAEVTELAGKQGWYINLNEPDDSEWVGEKALSEPLIFSSTAIVTTYLPASAGYVSAEVCKPNDGTAAIYYVNISDGTPTYSSTDELGERADRRTLLQRGGIPPTPSIIITDEGKPTLCVGTECDSATSNLNITKTYWYEIENTATVSP